jgi:hypothetical protein
VTLINKPVLMKHFGGQRNQSSSYTVAKTFYHYDVLNEFILSSQISPYRLGELSMAYELIDKIDKDVLMIYDRNFSNYKMIALHLWQEKEKKFLIRAKDSLKVVKSFIKSNAKSEIVDWLPTPSAIEGLRKSGFIINSSTVLKVRLVRVELENCVEVLVTNLWEEEGYLNEQFKELYFMRWGIETNIAIQKNILQLESFSGLSVRAIEQDFYATVFLANLHSALIKGTQNEIDEQRKNRKYPMKVNKNKSFGKLKKYITHLFITTEPKNILALLNEYFKKELIPIRKGRSYKRVRKNPQSNSKFKTFTNFKPAY